nr:ATP-grasp domain-containing protein [Selenomonas sp. oral taxon 920]
MIGCDIEADHAGWVFFDDCFVVERATSSNYMDSLMQLVEKEHIDLVIPSSEPELRTLYANDFFGRKDLFLTANKKAMEVGFDKYRTAEFLQKHGLPHPWTQIAAHGMPQEFPCILKSRTGCGSKDVRILTEENNCDQVFESKDEIFQELIEGDDAEYTCGLFRSSSGEIRSIILRRKLRGGLTGSGIVETNSEIEELLHAIALHLDLQGSINVQLRLRAGIPYVFEINPRFSSTVRFRYKLGFSDVIWSMQDFLHRVVDRYQTPMIGTRFYKIYEDIIG